MTEETAPAPQTTALTFDFMRVLSDDEKAEIAGIVDTWEGNRRTIREGFPRKHARHVSKAELRTHYDNCHPERVRLTLTPEVLEHYEPCERTDHEPIACRDCGRDIVAAAGTKRVLVCHRLHRLPVKAPCHGSCVIECGES